jgi:hypothetical protein
MKLLKIISILSLSFFIFVAEAQVKRANTLRRPSKSRTTKFLYANLFYMSYADQVIAQVQGQKEKARSIFSAFALGADYTFYSGRYLYGWYMNVLQGNVDIERILSTSYPRKTFLGLNTGPEVGYRLNGDMDLSYGLGVMYRDITDVGQSFVIANQMKFKIRLSPKLTFFQDFGNYGKAKSYSYSMGLRWLL